MARFTIYSPTGTALYTGTPSYTGQYMKPGLLEFREVAIPALFDLVPGCYVDYSRTGYRYRIYTVPQLKKQARSLSYGGAFVYQSVQLYDASKMLEYCPFRDLVLGDNRIHFSTQPAIATFEGCDGLARRFEACLRDQYDVGGVQSWAVRIADAYENPDLHDLMLEPRDFTVSGVNILECLDKIYEIWPGVGWLYTVENSVDTIVIGGVGTNSGTYAYGKGNGLTSLTRTAANAEEIANRIFAYGSSRNMLPRWYNSQNIKDAESVDIQNLMIPVLSWGLTDNLPDAAKAFVEDAASILKNGLRPATVYFDGNGEYPEIYPSIRETTIGMVRTAIGDSTAKNYPSTTIYTNPSQRIDQVLSAPASFDSGLAGNVPGKANVEMGDTPFSANSSFLMPAGITYYPFYHYQGTWTPETAGLQTIAWKLELSGQVQLDGIEKVTVSVQVKDPSYHGPVILSNGYDLTPDGSGIVILSGKEMVSEKVSVSAVSYIVNVDIAVYMAEQATDKTGTYTAVGNVGFALQNYRKKFFNISIRQVGFDINEQSALGNGKTIAMRTGKCAGRSFAINSVQYDSTNDCWNLECWRTEDESLSQWFPNTDYPVRGLENAGQSNEYPGDEFVLLDIAMPAIYVQMAEQKLLTAAQELLADTAVDRWQYSPEIDAKFMVENNRTINAGEYLLLSDADIIGQTAESVLVDTVTINEGESAIPTYKVTLRDRKKKTWTESQSPETSSSKSVGSITTTQPQSTSGVADSFFQLDEDGNVTLKPQYQNLWVPGWLTSGGVGAEGGGGGGLIETVLGVDDLDTPIVLEDLSETFSAKAIQTIWDAVKVLQNTTPNVSLVNGAGYSTLTVNGTAANFYTKSQVEALIGAIEQFHYEIYASTSAVTNPQGNVLYLIGPTGSGADKYEEYVYANNAWTKIGDTSIDLSGLPTLSGDNVFTGTNIFSGNIYSSDADPIWGIEGDGNAFFDNLVVGGVVVTPSNYVTALGVSGNYLTWTKGGVTNNITVPFATVAGKIGTATVGSTAKPVYINAGVPTLLGTVGTSTMPVYVNNGTITQISSFKEAYLSWGGKNFSGSYGPIDAAMVSELGACRTMFLKAAGIIIEYSTDAGQTWLDYGATDVQKVGLFSAGYGFVIGKATAATASANNMLRVTMHTNACGIYTTLNKFVIFVTTSGSTGCYCTIRCRTQENYENNVDSWTILADQASVSGWSGYNVINFPGTATYGNTKSSQYGEWQLIFGCTGHSGSSYAGLSVSKIFGFGGVGWTTPSTMAKTGHLYSFDANQNATFPAKVNCTGGSFSGALNLVCSSNATDTTKGLNLSYSNATAHIGISTLLGIYSSGNIVLRPNGASASGAGNGSLTISTDGIVANEKITAEGLVSSGSLTLSGSSNTARRIYFGDSSHYLELDEHGFHFVGAGLYGDSWVAAGGIGTGGGGSGSVAYLNDLQDVSASSPATNDLLRWNGSAWVNVPQSSIVPSIGFADLTSHPTTLSGYGITDASIVGGTITLGGNTLTPLTSFTETDPTVPDWAKEEEMQFTALPDLYALGTKVTDAPGLGILLGVSVMSANLATSADNDTSRVQWDHINNAWHFYGNVYVDGFLAAGGVGDGGPGGYGVESITSNQDGTVDFHFTGGDVTTVDLNHEHPQYPKYVVCTQAEYDALTTKDSDTLYLIPATA